MLVQDWHVQLACQLPARLVVGVTGMRARAGRTYNDYLGMLFRNLSVHIFEALNKLGRDLLLIAYAEIFQSERLGVSGSSPHLTPLGVLVAVSPFYEVECILHPFVHLLHGHHVLCLRRPHIPSAIGTLAAHSAWQYWHRLHVHVLAHLEIFIVTQSHRLMISPCVFQLSPLLLWSNGSLPAICVPESVATTMHHASAREAQELWIKSLKSLSQVPAQSVSLIGILRHERQLVDIHNAESKHQHAQGRIAAVAIGT